MKGRELIQRFSSLTRVFSVVCGTTGQLPGVAIGLILFPRRSHDPLVHLGVGFMFGGVRTIVRSQLLVIGGRRRRRAQLLESFSPPVEVFARCTTL